MHAQPLNTIPFYNGFRRVRIYLGRVIRIVERDVRKVLERSSRANTKRKSRHRW